MYFCKRARSEKQIVVAMPSLHALGPLCYCTHKNTLIAIHGWSIFKFCSNATCESKIIYIESNTRQDLTLISPFFSN